MIKRNPSLTDQAKTHIKEQILTNQYQDGRIPSESDLADELGVSRTTIRDALSRLEIEGTVYRRQGSGTFVNEPGLQIKSRLDEIWSYEEILKAHGFTPSTVVLDVRETIAPPKFDLTVDFNDPYHKPHLENFFNAIRGKEELNCPVDVGYETAVSVLKVNEAVKSGRKINFKRSEFKV